MSSHELSVKEFYSTQLVPLGQYLFLQQQQQNHAPQKEPASHYFEAHAPTVHLLLLNDFWSQEVHKGGLWSDAAQWCFVRPCSKNLRHVLPFWETHYLYIVLHLPLLQQRFQILWSFDMTIKKRKFLWKVTLLSTMRIPLTLVFFILYRKVNRERCRIRFQLNLALILNGSRLAEVQNKSCYSICKMSDLTRALHQVDLIYIRLQSDFDCCSLLYSALCFVQK